MKLAVLFLLSKTTKKIWKMSEDSQNMMMKICKYNFKKGMASMWPLSLFYAGQDAAFNINNGF